MSVTSIVRSLGYAKNDRALCAQHGHSYVKLSGLSNSGRAAQAVVDSCHHGRVQDLRNWSPCRNLSRPLKNQLHLIEPLNESESKISEVLRFGCRWLPMAGLAALPTEWINAHNITTPRRSYVKFLAQSSVLRFGAVGTTIRRQTLANGREQ